jgi:hypothetical protein
LQRIKLYQPKTKLEQFEDILIESQLLEQNLSRHALASATLSAQKKGHFFCGKGY